MTSRGRCTSRWSMIRNLPWPGSLATRGTRADVHGPTRECRRDRSRISAIHALDVAGAGQAQRQVPELLVRPRRPLGVLLRGCPDQGGGRGGARRGTRPDREQDHPRRGRDGRANFLGPQPTESSNRGERATGGNAFRTILFTDIVDSTALTQRLGDIGRDGLDACARPDRAPGCSHENCGDRGEAHGRRHHGVVRSRSPTPWRPR